MKKPKPTAEELRDDNYFLLRLYSIDLDIARESAAALVRGDSPGLAVVLVRDAVLSYCRPFSANRGRHGPHRLPEDPYVPTSARALHADLVKLRDKLFAHTDLDFHNSRVMLNIGTPEKPVYPMSFKGGEAANLARRAAEILALINEVEAALHREIERIQCEPWFVASDEAAQAKRRVVHRFVEADSDLSLEVRVPQPTALVWAPSRSRDEAQLEAVARERGFKEARELLRQRGISSGRWLVTCRIDGPELVQLL